MGMRGAVTQDDLNEEESKRFLAEYISKHELSWVVGLFGSPDRWPMMLYDADTEDGLLHIVDRKFQMVVHTYAAPGIDWHSLRMEYRENPSDPEWRSFRPSKQFEIWLTYQEKPNA